MTVILCLNGDPLLSSQRRGCAAGREQWSLVCLLLSILFSTGQGLPWVWGSRLGAKRSREQDRRRLSSTDLPGLERGSYTDNLRLREGAPTALRGCDRDRLAAWHHRVSLHPIPGPGSGLEEARDAPRAPLFKDPDTCLRLSVLCTLHRGMCSECVNPPHTLKKQKLTNVDDDMEEGGGLLHPWWEC